MSFPEYEARPAWHRTDNAYFPVAAIVDDQWWVLRINNWPDHPVWTLFVNGRRRFDLDDVPPNWGQPADRAAPSLSPQAAGEALAPIHTFDAYGSEIGKACDNPFCCGG